MTNWKNIILFGVKTALILKKNLNVNQLTTNFFFENKNKILQ